MNKLQLINNGFNEVWKFFKSCNPKTDEEWKYALNKSEELRQAFARQDERVGELVEKFLLATLKYKEDEYREEITNNPNHNNPHPADGPDGHPAGSQGK